MLCISVICLVSWMESKQASFPTSDIFSLAGMINLTKSHKTKKSIAVSLLILCILVSVFTIQSKCSGVFRNVRSIVFLIFLCLVVLSVCVCMCMGVWVGVCVCEKGAR